MKQAHDNWAHFYDFVYEKTFGSFYQELTAKTLLVIQDILPNGSIIDFGAGTGRLSFPLLQKGYSVVAVEKSKGMVEEIKRKSVLFNLDLEVFNCEISDFHHRKADFLLAIFTVLSYSITKEELSANIKSICRHIKPNGYFLFDLPSLDLLNEVRLTNIQTEHFNRIVDLIHVKDSNTFYYKERCSGIFKNEKFEYQDVFVIRYWSMDILDDLLQEYGLYNAQRTFPYFDSTGSLYRLYQRRSFF